jgi:hypothetical protein
MDIICMVGAGLSVMAKFVRTIGVPDSGRSIQESFRMPTGNDEWKARSLA